MGIWYLLNYTILKKGFAAEWVVCIVLITMKMFLNHDVVNYSMPEGTQKNKIDFSAHTALLCALCVLKKRRRERRGSAEDAKNGLAYKNSVNIILLSNYA